MTNKLSLSFQMLLCFALIIGLAVPPASAQENQEVDSSLIEGSVNPSKGDYSSQFLFKVRYVHEDNVGPKTGFPKLYLDNSELTMIENRVGDTDFTDGKIYKYTWNPKSEDFGTHLFHFIAESKNGGVYRFPAEGAIEGPTITGRGISIDLSLMKEDGNLLFSGKLNHDNDKVNISGREITISKIGQEENEEMRKTRTSENGYFEVYLELPEEKGFYRFIALNPGWGEYEGEKSNSIFYNSIDSLYVSLVPLLVIVASVIGIGFFLKKRLGRSSELNHFLLGVLLGWTIFQLFGFTPGILIGGAIIGYFVSDEFDDLKGKLAIGICGGLGGISAYFSMNILNLIRLPEIMESKVLYTSFSMSQGSFLNGFLITNLRVSIIYITLTLAGLILGGSLKGIIRERETLKDEDENN